MKGVLITSVLLPVTVAGRMKGVLITSVLLCMLVPDAGRTMKDVLNYTSTSASPSRWTNDVRCTYYISTSASPSRQPVAG